MIVRERDNERDGERERPRKFDVPTAIVIVLAGMTCMMFVPCILVQDEDETRLNRKQY